MNSFKLALPQKYSTTADKGNTEINCQVVIEIAKWGSESHSSSNGIIGKLKS